MPRQQTVELETDSRLSRRAEGGFSLVELIVVIGIIIIMTTFAVFSISGSKKAYQTDDQSKRVLDILRDASVRALTKRRSMRVEFNATTNQIALFDEKGAGAADDFLVRRDYLARTGEVRFESAPATIGVPNPPNYTAASFVTTAPSNNRIWMIRFKLDGTVVNPTNNAPTSATIVVWQPKPGAPLEAENSKLVRAITIFGGTGAVRYWKYNGTAFVTN